ELNGEFKSEKGRKAISRLLLLGAISYGILVDEYRIDKIASLCKTDIILKTFLNGKTPSSTTLSRFLSNSNYITIKKIFLHTLLVLNDHHILKFLHIFIDGTDALIKGSKHYTITRDELKALKLMKKWNLLHDKSKNSIRRIKKELKIKEQEYKKDQDILESIQTIRKRIKIYNKNMSQRINEFEDRFKEIDNDYVSITFPEAVMMP
ncbi:transposase, partial [Methanobrevibacter filiformis]|uniref:transposase n=1 Tax=Methanobrevibacter filiformis TaxID=55758 RepID=UPI000A0225BB